MHAAIETPKPIEIKEQRCPNCHATIPAHPNYVVWCDQCNWNLQLEEAERPRTLFESLYATMGKRFSQELFEGVKHSKSLRPTWTLSKILALALAALVHSLTLAFVILGVVLLVRGWPYLTAIIGGGLCLLTAWALRPRLGQQPTDALSKHEHPALYEIADRVAQSLSAQKVDGIVVDEQFNASFEQVGWRRKRILRLGLPLLSILDSQEKAALIAHELAHDVNGDPSRTVFISAAVNALSEWHRLLIPDEIWPAGAGLRGLLMIPFNLLMLGLSYLAWLAAFGLVHLLWHDTQRAEYLADHLASNVSGTDAMLAMLHKLHYERSFAYAVQKAALHPDIPDLFAEFRQRIAAMPEYELERIRRVAKLEGARLNVTHPPTPYRIELLQARRVAGRQVALSPLDAERIEQELVPFHKKIQAKLVDQYTASIYRRYA